MLFDDVYMLQGLHDFLTGEDVRFAIDCRQQELDGF